MPSRKIQDSASALPAATTAAVVEPSGSSPAGLSGPQLSAADMSVASALLIEQAAEVTLLIKLAADDAEAGKLLEQHRALIASAMSLNNKAIDLLAGDAAVSGADIVAAISKANVTLKSIAEIETALTLVQKVLVLATAVLTGNGYAIATAVIKLSE